MKLAVFLVLFGLACGGAGMALTPGSEAESAQRITALILLLIGPTCFVFGWFRMLVPDFFQMLTGRYP